MLAHTITRLSRRAALQLFGTSAAATLLAACGPSVAPSASTSVAPAAAPTNPPPAAPPVSAPGTPVPAVTGVAANTTATSAAAQPGVGQPKRGGTLRIADMDLPRLDGHLIYTNGINISWLPYDRLTQYDAKLQPQPMLAESWDASSDYKQITLHLRHGVQFHSGRELTSEDIKWNLLRVRDPKLGVAQLATQSAWFTSIETPDRYTVMLTTEQPRPFMFDFFEYFNILDSVSKQGPESELNVIGTGPFVWQEYRQGESARLVKNPNYWRSGLPYLDELDIGFVADQQAAVVAFEAGQFDVLAPPVRDAVRLSKDPLYRLRANDQSGRHYLLAVNTTMPPGDSKPIRQALSYALDRKRIAEQVLQNAGAVPHVLPWPTSVPAYDAARDQTYTFDLDRAHSLLGGRTDVGVEITVASSSADTVSMAQMYQADLQTAGFKATVKAMDSAAILQYADMQKNPGLWINQSGYAHLGPQAMCTISRHWNIGSNAEGFSSDQYREIVNNIATEPDLARRKPLYDQLNDFLLDEQFVIVVASNAESIVTRANLQGVRWDGHGARVYAEMWQA